MSPKRLTICSVKSVTFSKRNKSKKQPLFSTRKQTRNNQSIYSNNTKTAQNERFFVCNYSIQIVTTYVRFSSVLSHPIRNTLWNSCGFP